MVRKKGVFLVIILSVCFFASAVSVFGADTLFSENTAAIFIKQASEIHDQDPLDEKRTNQAAAFLDAARALDPLSAKIPQQMLEVFTANCFDPLYDQDDMMWAMGEQLKERWDVQLATKAVGCLLEQLNTRVDRGVLLQQLTRKYASQNPVFASDLATQMGFLAMEKADISAATNYFTRAFQLNRFNTLALSQAFELSGAQTQSQNPALEPLMYRIRLTVNPYDFDAAIAYAATLKRLQIYDVAADAYEYAAQLHEMLNPDSSMPEEIIRSWALNCYHVRHSEIKVLEIADRYRSSERFDLLLESIAGRTLIKLGQAKKGRLRLEEAAQKAQVLMSVKGAPNQCYPEQLAWFYSFVLEDPEKALAWGNQAFVQAPERPGVRSIFAYALSQNGQYELAAEYAEPLRETDQIAALTMALVQLSEDQKEGAILSLKNAVDMASETFAAEKGIRLLKAQDSEYISSIPAETIRNQLQGNYSQLVPEFTPLSSRYSVRLLFNGSDFLYAADFPARLVIENTSSEPLVISDEGLLKGSLRVDARVEGGLNVEIPNLYAAKFRPDKPVLPGEYLTIPLDLNRGRLRKLLLTYPQADVGVIFTAYLDTFVMQPAASGDLENRIPSVQGAIRRRGIVLTGSFLMQRLDVLTKGQVGQKYEASSLFTGLLAEKIAIQRNQMDFSYQPVDQELIVDAIRKILTDDDWKVRVHTMDCLSTLSIPLEGQMIFDVSQNLNHQNWPVRLAAMYLLANIQSDSFQKVLDWTAEHDPSPYVRQMAVSLGAKEPQTQTIVPPSDPNE